MQEPQSYLDLGAPPQPQKTVSKKGFAEMIGVSQGRISQMITAGLPVEANGRINIAEGRMWVADNVDQNRRRSGASGDSLYSPKAQREIAEAQIAQLKAERLGGRLVERSEFEGLVFKRARAERDAWQSWPLRIAGEMAAELKIEESVLLAVLQRLVREQLTDLAERNVDDILR